MSAVEEATAVELEKHTATVRKLIPLFDAMQLRVVRLEPGAAAAEIPAEPNVNHFGVMYAGALFSVAEVLGGLLPPATWDIQGYVPIVADMQIAFLKPAMGAIRATAEVEPAEVERVDAEIAAGSAKIWFTLAAALTDTDGNTVARTTGKYLLRRFEGSAASNA